MEVRVQLAAAGYAGDQSWLTKLEIISLSTEPSSYLEIITIYLFVCLLETGPPCVDQGDIKLLEMFLFLLPSAVFKKVFLYRV